jgi:large subunit ribosomal protein L35
MPKMKGSSAAKKRLKVTSGGKIKHRRAFDSHNFEHKSAKRKRHKRRLKGLAPSDYRKALRLLGRR